MADNAQQLESILQQMRKDLIMPVKDVFNRMASSIDEEFVAAIRQFNSNLDLQKDAFKSFSQKYSKVLDDTKEIADAADKLAGNVTKAEAANKKLIEKESIILGKKEEYLKRQEERSKTTSQKLLELEKKKSDIYSRKIEDWKKSSWLFNPKEKLKEFASAKMSQVGSSALKGVGKMVGDNAVGRFITKQGEDVGLHNESYEANKKELKERQKADQEELDKANSKKEKIERAKTAPRDASGKFIKKESNVEVPIKKSKVESSSSIVKLKNDEAKMPKSNLPTVQDSKTSAYLEKGKQLNPLKGIGKEFGSAISNTMGKQFSGFMKGIESIAGFTKNIAMLMKPLLLPIVTAVAALGTLYLLYKVVQEFFALTKDYQKASQSQKDLEEAQKKAELTFSEKEKDSSKKLEEMGVKGGAAGILERVKKGESIDKMGLSKDQLKEFDTFMKAREKEDITAAQAEIEKKQGGVMSKMVFGEDSLEEKRKQQEEIMKKKAEARGFSYSQEKMLKIELSKATGENANVELGKASPNAEVATPTEMSAKRREVEQLKKIEEDKTMHVSKYLDVTTGTDTSGMEKQLGKLININDKMSNKELKTTTVIPSQQMPMTSRKYD